MTQPIQSDASTPPDRETVATLLSDIDAWFARSLPITDEANDYINEDGWSDAQALHTRLQAALRGRGEGGAGEGQGAAGQPSGGGER